MSSYLTFVYQGYLISFNQISCMQFSRYDTDWYFISHIRGKIPFLLISLVKPSIYLIRLMPVVLFLVWRPPALPHRLQCSTIGRLRLNRRVRDGNGCFPQAHRHQKLFSYHTFVPVLTLSRIRYASSRWSQSFIYIFLCMSSIWYASIPSVIHPRNLCTHSLIAKQWHTSNSLLILP